MIKVLLVNEQKLFNEAVESLLSTEEDIEVVGAVTTGQDAMDQIQGKEPDIILLDIHMSSVDGIRLTVHIKDNYPHIKVIFLTTFSEKELVVAGILAGGDGFLLKNIDTDNLLQSIRNVYKGQIIISGEAAKILAQDIVELKYGRHDILKKGLEKRNIHLSEREVQIAILMLDKLTNRGIAKKLHLSEGTVKNYVSDVYGKLNVNTRKSAIEFLQSFGTIYNK